MAKTPLPASGMQWKNDWDNKMGARWQRIRVYFSMNQAGVITAKSSILFLLPLLLLLTYNTVVSGDISAAVFVEALLSAALGSFSFYFTFILLARLLALGIRTPMHSGMYLAIIAVLFSPIAIAVVRILQAEETPEGLPHFMSWQILLTVSYLALPFICSSYLFYRADKKVASPSAGPAISSL